MALALKGSNITNIGSFCEILNYSQGDTINHCLVLLEGEINTRIENSSTRLEEAQEEETLKPKNNICINEDVPDKTICSTEKQELSNSEEHEILVHHKQFCQTWPIIGGKFKALVKLDKGVNKLEFECPWLHSRQDLILTYEKLQNQPRFVKVVYIKCSDSSGKFDSPEDRDNDIDAAIEKLRFNALLLQTFTAVDMCNHGFGFQTFQLEEDQINGEVVVHVFDSKLTTEQAHKMNGDQLYNWFHTELLDSSLHDPNCKFLVFMSCTHYDPPDEIDAKHITKYVKAHTALGGGHLGLFGTGGLHTWAKDVGELVRCFTDCREIDKRKLFDDSAGRGTFWANYSTTLGAALHELGHCFDLAHTTKGIMGRGFDDLNHFFTVTQRKIQRSCSTELVAPGYDVEKIFINHEAHWFRSSAIILHYHKWFRPCSERISAENENIICPQINWSPCTRGPVGNGGGGQKNQAYFDDNVFSGYEIFHNEYINALKLLNDANGTNRKDSPILGKVDEKCTTHVFLLEEGEYLTSIEVCAGAWIDGIRFHTNWKSSIWFGGQGGTLYHLKPNAGDRITGIFGTFGDFIGSLGVRVSGRSSSNEMQAVSNLEIQSDLGIRLVELRKKDDLVKYWEFVEDDNPPKTFHVPWQAEENLEDCSVFVVDNEGNTCESGLVGFKRFIERARESESMVASLI